MLTSLKMLVGRRAPYLVLALSAVTTGVVILAVSSENVLPVILSGIAVSAILFGVATTGRGAAKFERIELSRTRTSLARHTERLRILHEIDRAVADQKSPGAIAGAAVQPLRELLGVRRAVVNLFDLSSGQVEWLAAAGRRRIHVGPGVRYSIQMMGDVEALKRGEPQLIDTRKLPPGPEVDALLASGVEMYMAVPMIAGGELIGALSFGGAPGPFPPEQIAIAREIATQFAIAIAQARLYDQVRRQADDLEVKVRERTQELRTAHAAQQKTNAELLQRTAQLQAANKELEAFSYSVSHDLRAPLRGIDGFAQALIEDYHDDLDETARGYLNRIRLGARRMGELIDDMLQLAQVSRVELHRQPVDLSELARAVLDELKNAEPDRNVQLDIQDGLIAEADSRLMRVLLENLLGNAWKFTAKTDRPRIAFAGERRDEAITYYVRDNGAGFDMNYASKLFRPFERLHTEAQFTGTGIGLATVARIVARHGGRVWAEGAVDFGATFFFTLP